MEPKNALGKQYKKLFWMNHVRILHCVTWILPSVFYLSFFTFSFESQAFCLPIDYHTQVKLHFTEKASKLIAKKAMAKNTGARGLRAILESILTDAMYEVSYI